MMDKKQVKAIADKEVKAHEKRMHPGAKKMAAGGKTNAQMLKYGRGMAKVMNQRITGRGG
jgi:hypothetical protein